MTGPPVVSVSSLSKNYGSQSVLHDVSFNVGEGEVFVLLGPNGTGKTTTLEILEGHRERDAGAVEVLGADPARADRAWRSRIGMVLQGGGVECRATVEEILVRFSAYYPRPRPVDEVVSSVGLADWRATRTGDLSFGGRRRLELALALLPGPEVLFLDEPTAGFDAVSRRSARELVSSLAAAGTTVLMTTHDMGEAEMLADRVGILVQGTLVAQGSVTSLTEGQRSEISFSLPAGTSRDHLPAGLKLDAEVGYPGLGPDCEIGPIDAVFEADSYDLETGEAELVANGNDVPAAENCGDWTDAINGRLGLPTLGNSVLSTTILDADGNPIQWEESEQ